MSTVHRWNGKAHNAIGDRFNAAAGKPSVAAQQPDVAHDPSRSMTPSSSTFLGKVESSDLGRHDWIHLVDQLAPGDAGGDVGRVAQFSVPRRW